MSDLLPPNATPQERALSLALARLGDVPVPIVTLMDPDACPLGLLPWLAWALSVDAWESAWPEAQKRLAIRQALELHRRKGTPWAVEAALLASGAPNARVEEWWEYAGDPGHFRVEIELDGESVPGGLEAELLRSIAKHKNARSVLDGLVYNLATRGDVPALSLGAHTVEVVTIYP